MSERTKDQLACPPLKLKFLNNHAISARTRHSGGCSDTMPHSDSRGVVTSFLVDARQRVEHRRICSATRAPMELSSLLVMWIARWSMGVVSRYRCRCWIALLRLTVLGLSFVCARLLLCSALRSLVRALLSAPFVPLREDDQPPSSPRAPTGQGRHYTNNNKRRKDKHGDTHGSSCDERRNFCASNNSRPDRNGRGEQTDWKSQEQHSKRTHQLEHARICSLLAAVSSVALQTSEYKEGVGIEGEQVLHEVKKKGEQLYHAACDACHNVREKSKQEKRREGGEKSERPLT